MPFDLSIPQLLVFLIIALVILGPKRLPEVGPSLGRGIREFKDSVTGDDKDDDEEAPRRPAAGIEPPQPVAYQPQQSSATEHAANRD